MTNEQAKKMLKAKLECLKRETSGTDFDCNNSNCDECSLCYEQGNMREQKEALDMAIEALEQQPCEDAISRQAAIDALMAWEEDYFWDKECVKYRGDPYWVAPSDVIEQLPSAQPERIKGHWVEIASSNHTYKCSVCGRLLVNITDGKNNVAKNYPYCHCGADMRGEQDG